MKTFYDYDLDHPFDVVGEKQTIKEGKIRLDYIPQVGTVSIEGFTESENTDVSGNKFFIDYSVTSRYRMATGFVTFDTKHDGEEVTINYKGVSTLVLAKHMNEIKEFMENFKDEIDSRIQNVIGSAPDSLDTLQELADALGGDPNFATTIMDVLKTKLDKDGGEIENNLTVNGNVDVKGVITGSINGKASSSDIASTLSDGGTSKGMKFFCTEKNESPKYLWGGMDGENMYVYSPSLLNVNYAESAGNVSWENVSSKPSEYNPAPHIHNEYALIDGNTIHTSNWFRSKENTGWMNETYGGGIYMEDEDYVKVYGGKSFYCPDRIVTDDNVIINENNGTDAEVFLGGKLHAHDIGIKNSNDTLVFGTKDMNREETDEIGDEEDKTAWRNFEIDFANRVVKAQDFVYKGNVEGNVTGNVTGSSGSCTGNAATATNVAWSGVTGKPTTLGGYGITDAPTKTGGGASGTWGINISGSSGSCTGNAATATKATQDKNGLQIDTGYLKLTGGTVKGILQVGAKTGSEGGQIELLSSDAVKNQNGIILDQCGNRLRIFGIQSADGTTRKGVGTTLEIDPYAKTITGGYTFTGNLNGNATMASYVGSVNRGDLVKGTKPSGTIWTRSSIVFEKSGTAGGNRIHEHRCFVEASGRTGHELLAYDYTAGSGAAAVLGIYKDMGGAAYAMAPTPATADNSTKIATTAFVRSVVPTLNANTAKLANQTGQDSQSAGWKQFAYGNYGVSNCGGFRLGFDAYSNKNNEETGKLDIDVRGARSRVAVRQWTAWDKYVREITLLDPNGNSIFPCNLEARQGLRGYGKRTERNGIFDNSGLVVLEKNMAGNTQSDFTYAPSIGFHWRNKVGASLNFHCDGIFYLRKQDGNTRATLDADIRGHVFGDADVATTAKNIPTSAGQGNIWIA